jgi:hypothetical protein
LGISNITKVDFLAELPKIREKTFKSSTIKRSFKEAGIWPWNPEVVISKLKIPEKTPEPVISEIPKITPTTIAEMEEIRLHTINGTLSPTFAIKKLVNAFIVLASQTELLQTQINAMTAASKRKTEMNVSRKQILHPIGEMHTNNVKNARNAVLGRAEKEELKKTACRRAKEEGG